MWPQETVFRVGRFVIPIRTTGVWATPVGVQVAHWLERDQRWTELSEADIESIPQPGRDLVRLRWLERKLRSRIAHRRRDELWREYSPLLERALGANLYAGMGLRHCAYEKCLQPIERDRAPEARYCHDKCSDAHRKARTRALESERQAHVASGCPLCAVADDSCKVAVRIDTELGGYRTSTRESLAYPDKSGCLD